MTEAEWLHAADPQPMLDFLHGKASLRKLRLFGSACCRGVWNMLTDERSRRAVEVAERAADGKGGGKEEVAAAWEEARQAALDLFDQGAPVAVSRAAHFARYVLGGWPERAARVAEGPEDQAKQAGLLRDIFGNPFHRITVDPAWQTPAVTTLAEAVYESRSSDYVPLLAEALRTAGCHEPAVIRHCLQPAGHVRGCWVLDLLLGKN